MTYDQPNGVVKVYQDGEERTDLRYDYVLPTLRTKSIYLHKFSPFSLVEIAYFKSSEFHTIFIYVLME